jgi:hypothetical protein
MAVFTLHPMLVEKVGTDSSDPIDVSEYEELHLMLRISEVRGTAIVSVRIEHSFDGIHWRNLCWDYLQGVFRQLNSVTSDSIKLTKFSRFIRASWAVDADDASNSDITFEIAGIGR